MKDEGLQDALKAAWHRFIDLVAEDRPLLHGYCLRLTGNVWDAEDLVQDTLLRGFGTLGKLDYEVANRRAYLLRMATNAWIDALRRRETAARHVPDPPAGAPTPDTGRAVRDAGAELIGRLAPQERAAVVLKDVFELSLAEIAEVVGTSVGAVKAALHRGRSTLTEASPAARPRRAVSEELLDRFVARFNAGDPKSLASLMLEQGSVEMLGCAFASGPEGLDTDDGWFHGALEGHPEWPAIFRFDSPRVEAAELDGEPIVLSFRTRGGVEALEGVIRLEEADGGIARLRIYAFCPETVRYVGERLGLSVRTGLYRYPTPAPGERYA